MKEIYMCEWTAHDTSNFLAPFEPCVALTTYSDGHERGTGSQDGGSFSGSITARYIYPSKDIPTFVLNLKRWING
jgi:hypothetical protein